MSGTTDHTEADPEHPGGGPRRAWLAARAREKAAIMEVKRLTAEREALLAVAQAAQALSDFLEDEKETHEPPRELLDKGYVALERAADYHREEELGDALRAALGRLNQDTP